MNHLHCIIYVYCILSSYRSLSADSIRPLCVDADPTFQQCDSGQLTFTSELIHHLDNGRTINIGLTRYEQVYGRYTDYRPIYMYEALVPGGKAWNRRYRVYLFHAFGHWRLGDDYTTSTSAFARVDDTALRPEFITGDWQLYFNGTWNRDSDRRVRCSGTYRLRCFVPTRIRAVERGISPIARNGSRILE